MLGLFMDCCAIVKVKPCLKTVATLLVIESHAHRVEIHLSHKYCNPWRARNRAGFHANHPKSR